MATRSLASIQKVRAIKPIENADRIEVAVINDWEIVIKKDEFKVDQSVIYCEIDSFLPIREEFEFLRKNSYKKMGEVEGFHLRTRRILGQISQGLIIPLDIIGEPAKKEYENEIGKDLSEMLNIVLYDPPLNEHVAAFGYAKGNFPSFLRKTSEQRIQNLTKKYDSYKEKLFYVTEKIDGTSATFYFNRNTFGVCSRNYDLLETQESHYWIVAQEYNIREKLIKLNRNIAIQGEIIGNGISGNKYNMNKFKLLVFTIFNIDTAKRVDFNEFNDLVKQLELEAVPIIDLNYKIPNTINELIKSADGKSKLNQSVIREGLVVRSYDGEVSFKAISNKFLLKFDAE